MIELFPLELEYCEAVARIAKECLPECWSLDGIRDVLQYDNNIFYVAKDVGRDEIVAYAGIMVIVDEAELLNIAVTQAYRKMGIAQQLIEQLLAMAKQFDAYRMLLEVRQSNQPAIDFYRKNGFSEIAERKNYYSNPIENAIIMERLL